MIDFEEDIIGEAGSGEFAPTREAGLWVTKYRPRSLEHFCLDAKLKKKFQNQILMKIVGMNVHREFIFL